METCCNSENINVSKSTKCNECGNAGKPVKRKTLEHLLIEKRVSSIRDIQYFFCSSSHCDVVYFTIDTDIFHKADLKVRVGLKETDEPIPVCYCFGYTRNMIIDDLIKNGRSMIKEDITKKINEGICQCEVTNPEGVCCLGNVSLLVKSIAAAKSNIILESIITCPECNFAKAETMPTDSCRFFYECTNCKTVLKPKEGDCCVFCSHGDVPCPPIQVNKKCC